MRWRWAAPAAILVLLYSLIVHLPATLVSGRLTLPPELAVAGVTGVHVAAVAAGGVAVVTVAEHAVELAVERRRACAAPGRGALCGTRDRASATTVFIHAGAACFIVWCAVGVCSVHVQPLATTCSVHGVVVVARCCRIVRRRRRRRH